MIDFPDAPSTGEIYTSGTRSWQFDGTVWRAMSEDLLAKQVTTSLAGTALENMGPIEELTEVTTVSGTKVLDTSVYGSFALTMTANTEFVFANPAPVGYRTTFNIDISGGFTPTFPGTVRWPADTPPGYNKVAGSRYVFTTTDAGSTWFGMTVLPAAPSGGIAHVVTGTPAAFFGASIDLSWPAGTSSGDFALAIINRADDGAITADADWTLLTFADGTAGQDSAMGVWYRIVDGTESATYNFSASFGREWGGVIVVYSGVDTGTPIDTDANSARVVWSTINAAEWSGTLATGYADGDWLLSIIGGIGDAGTVTFPTGVDVERVNVRPASATPVTQTICVGETVISGTPTPGVWVQSANGTGGYGVVSPILLKAA